MNKKKQTVAEYISEQIRISGRLQREIAVEIGYDKPNMITMIKKGLTPLPLDKVGPLAYALEIDPLHLFKLVMAEYYPATFDALRPFLRGLDLSEDELRILANYRAMTRIEPDDKLH